MRSTFARASISSGVAFLMVAGFAALPAEAKKKPKKAKRVTTTTLFRAASPTTLPAPPITVAPITTGPYVAASPAIVVSTATSRSLGLALEGSGFYSRSDLILSSPDMAACTSRTFGKFGSDFASGTLRAMTNYSGTFNVSLTAKGCPAGTYEVTASEANPPKRVAKVMVTVQAATANPPRLSVLPASQVPTSTGAIATALVVQGLAANQSYRIEAGALAAACGPGQFQAGQTGGTVSLASLRADAFGNDVVAIQGDSCFAGTYAIHLLPVGGSPTSVPFTVQPYSTR